MRRGLFVFLLASLVFLSGCPKNTITNLPPGVSETTVNNWVSATQNLDTAYSVTHVLKTTVIATRNNGGFPDDANYAKALESVGKMIQVELAAADALKAAPNDWSKPLTDQVFADINLALEASKALNIAGATGIKNPQSLTSINNLITQVQGVLNIILSLKTTVTTPTSATVAIIPSAFVIEERGFYGNYA